MGTPLPIRSDCDGVSDPPMISIGERKGFIIVRIILGILLLIAAALKGHELITEPTIGISWLDARWLMIVTVEFELFFGFWLLSNLLPKPTWAVSLACFGMFTCTSLYEALSGYTNCGCFGRLPVNPWYSSLLDLGIVFSLLHWRPDERSFTAVCVSELSSRAVIVLGIWLAIGVPAAFLAIAANYGSAQLTEDGVIIGDGNIVVLEPQQWAGNRFPLLPYIEDVSESAKTGRSPLRERLVEGEWLVVLYRSSCPKCREMLNHFRQNVEQGNHGPKQSISLAIIVMSPDVPARMPDGCEMGKLGGDYRWFLKVSMAIRLRNGIVEPAEGDVSDVEAGMSGLMA
jgi:hypothetical protein